MSGYILEMRIDPGGARKGVYFYYENFDKIKEAVYADLNCMSNLYFLLWYGEYTNIYHVIDNVVVETIDIHQFISIEFPELPLIKFEEDNELMYFNQDGSVFTEFKDIEDKFGKFRFKDCYSTIESQEHGVFCSKETHGSTFMKSLLGQITSGCLDNYKLEKVINGNTMTKTAVLLEDELQFTVFCPHKEFVEPLVRNMEKISEEDIEYIKTNSFFYKYNQREFDKAHRYPIKITINWDEMNITKSIYQKQEYLDCDKLSRVYYGYQDHEA